MANTGSIGGIVVNQQDGSALDGVNLTLDAGSETTTTGPNGEYSFSGLPAGKYELTAKKDGFEDGVYGPLVVVDGETKINVALQPAGIA